MLLLIWVAWFFNIGLMLIILMNFLIAVISDSYAEVDQNKIQYVYKDKAEMNLDCQQLLALIFPQIELKCVAFSIDKQAWTEEADLNKGLKDFVMQQNKEMEARLKTSIDEVFTKMMLVATQNNESVLNEFRLIRNQLLARRLGEETQQHSLVESH